MAGWKSNWQLKSIADVTKRVKVGYVGTCQKDYCDETVGVPMIRTTNLGRNGIDYSDLKYVTKEFHEKNKKSQLHKNDILIARHGENGRACIVEKEIEANCLNVVVIEPDTDIVLPNFLKYLFDYSEIKYQIQGFTVGSVQSVVNTKTIAQLKIPVPSIVEQESIVSILRNYDEKIAVNTRINRNLSEQLQSIYLNRFSEELNGELTDLCEYSKVKMDVVDITRESYFSTENMLPNKMGSTTASKLPSTKKIPKCKKGDVLVSNIRPYFKKIVYCHEEAGHSTDVLCFSPKQRDVSSYIYATLYADKFFDYMVAGSKGTKMPRGDKQQIMKYPIHIPTKQELVEFGTMAENILNVIRTNEDENKRLVGIRDTLLSKLMSGELDVTELYM